MFSTFDMHCHILCGTDDGAATEEEMFRMLDMSYADGVRGICFTPHYQYTFYGDNRDAGASAFERAREYAAKNYPDMELYLGNELFYHADALEYLNRKECRTLNGSRYVLMDFESDVSLHQIQKATSQLISHGYRPVLAHVERYAHLGTGIKQVEEFVAEGCVIQVNASSFTGEWGRMAKWRAKKLLSHYVIHVIASDAHHENFRKPGLSACANWISDKYGEDYARELFDANPRKIIRNERISW